MKKFNIWVEGYYATGMDYPAKAQLVATKIEGENFIDAVKQWAINNPKLIEDYGGFFIRSGHPYLWSCELFDNEEDARKSFG